MTKTSNATGYVCWCGGDTVRVTVSRDADGFFQGHNSPPFTVRCLECGRTYSEAAARDRDQIPPYDRRRDRTDYNWAK